MKPSSHATTPRHTRGARPHRDSVSGRIQNAGAARSRAVASWSTCRCSPGERFSDLPECTHPAVAAVAWRINDELCATTRQKLLRRAPALVGAGRELSRPVRPIVLGVIADAALALDPEHRYFHRLRR